MRRIFFVAALLVGGSLLAQEKPVISSAVIAIDRNNDVEGAKGYIDEAGEIIANKDLSEIKSKDLAKFYFYKGKINYRVTQNPALAAKFPTALDQSLQGFIDLLDLERKTGKERYTNDAVAQVQYLANDIAKRGIEANSAGNFEEAYNDFLKTYELKKMPGIEMTDTNMYFNAAIMAQQGKMYDKSLAIYKDLIDMKYKGVTFSAVDTESGDTVVFPSKGQMDRMVESGKFTSPMVEGDVRPDLYKSVIYMSLAAGDTAAYAEWVQKGRAMFPENPDLLRAELQLFFDNKEYDKALANLDQAIAQDPENVVMYYNKGVILQREMKRLDDALVAYERALEIDSMYSDALYMSSIIYIDRANAIGEKMNALPLNATKKYNALAKDQKAVFQVALPYLEKAKVSNPGDEQVKSALMQVYRALKMYDKAKALQEEQ